MLFALSSRRRLSAAVMALGFLVSPNSLKAQDPTSPAALVPPRLVESSEPEYPAEAKARGESAIVTLLLEVDETGAVARTTVTSDPHPAFDAAAIAAAAHLRFQPATRAGKPIKAKIPFQFAFASERDVAPSAGTAPSNGTAGAAPATGATPSNGVSPGPAPAPSKEAATTKDTTDAKTPGDGAAPAPGETSPSAFVDIEVRGQRPVHDATTHVIEREELARMPGTNGDALHAVENMPGVARTSGISSDLVVRGSAPQDTAVFADGVWLINAFHFGGLTSILPTEILERLDFHPGNFSPEFGRQIGGIVDIGIRSPRKDRIGGLLQFDLLDGRFLVEGPLGDKTRFLAAGRRSWIDAWLGPALRSAGNGVSAAPVYYDYQAMIEHDISSRTTARLLFFGADDRFAITVNSPSASDPGLGGDIGQVEAFLRLQARLDTRLSDNVRFINMATIGSNTERFSLGTLKADAVYNVIDTRSDLRARLSPAVTAVGGFTMLAGHYDVTFVAPAQPSDGEVPGPIFGSPQYTMKGDGMLWRPGGYAMLELAPMQGVNIVPGVRVDYSSESRQWTADPRLSARVNVFDKPLRTTLKGGIGAYHQPPQPFQALAPFGTPSVKNNAAIHYSLGIEQELAPNIEVSLEGFYKDLHDLIVARPAATSSSGGTEYVNTGEGRAYGTELLARWKPQGPFSGWIAYTMSRSERRRDASEPFAVSDYDQTHILNALGSYKLGRGWSVGTRFRYVTGNPYTPYVGAIADLDAGAYTPVRSPLANSGRVSAFHSLDLRVDKTWTLGDFKLTAYLDVRNVYNRQNPETVTYNYNYSQSQPLAGLPILPIIGLRGEL